MWTISLWYSQKYCKFRLSRADFTGGGLESALSFWTWLRIWVRDMFSWMNSSLASFRQPTYIFIRLALWQAPLFHLWLVVLIFRSISMARVLNMWPLWIFWKQTWPWYMCLDMWFVRLFESIHDSNSHVIRFLYSTRLYATQKKRQDDSLGTSLLIG